MLFGVLFEVRYNLVHSDPIYYSSVAV